MKFMKNKSKLVLMVGVLVFGMLFAGCSFKAEVDVDTHLFSSANANKGSGYLTAPSSCGSENL